PLGPLSQLPGRWVGQGFNQIWRPFFSNPNPTGQGHFLELNVTNETIQFDIIPGKIPNRGLLQEDIFMFGVSYLQQVFDALVPGNPGLHFEPGMWLTVPPTTNPEEPATVCRLGSIPHGTSILAQGIATPPVQGPPQFDPVDITPFVIGDPGRRIPFSESNLSQPSQFRIPSEANPPGITQAMVDNPNSILEAAIAGQTITEMVVLTVSTTPVPVLGGGTANTAFLEGTPPPPANANAQAAEMSAIFWIETVQGQGDEPDFLQLQYTQTVLLDFAGLSWPHVSVATLRQTVANPPSRDEVDPPTPDAIYKATESAAR
ncbi:MAG TPA: heme-binding protein, partial [bacterium]|nr:heme-binding protein [bacterium]